MNLRRTIGLTLTGVALTILASQYLNTQTFNKLLAPFSEKATMEEILGKKKRKVITEEEHRAYETKLATTVAKMNDATTYSVLVTATWCSPCRRLEAYTAGAGLEKSINQTLWTEDTPEYRALRNAFLTKGVDLRGALPVLIIKTENELQTYKGFHEEEACMYRLTDPKECTPVTDILRKE